MRANCRFPPQSGAPPLQSAGNFALASRTGGDLLTHTRRRRVLGNRGQGAHGAM